MKRLIEFKRNYEKGSKDNSDIIWDIINKQGDVLGDIGYYEKWKKWVFEGGDCCFFDTKCLKKIIEFMEKI